MNNGTYSPTFSSNSTGGAITVKRFAAGVYEVTIPGFSDLGNVAATTYGTAHARCTAGNLGSSGGNEFFEVSCNKILNWTTLVDEPFMVQYTD